MRPWWKEAIIYQIYPRSFKDSNNDGDGDIQGIISKLDYLANLGIDAIWLSPIYLSPMKDNGYDVANYYEINPMFGSMEDFDELIVESKKRNIKIIMDLVCNHTSTEHPWFKEAIKDPNSKFHDYYFFRKKPDDKKSSFGGSAWCYVKEIDEYYYHYFDESQADLNWANEEVRKEVSNIVKFWMEKGCGGFRLDAIELIGKDLEQNIICNGPGIHDYLHELNQNAFALYDAMSVGEGWPTVPIALDYTKESRSELSMIFQFETATLDWNTNFAGKYNPVEIESKKLKESITRWQKGLEQEGWNTLFLENHDLGRSVSRYGNDGKYWRESAKMLATMMAFLKGTLFLYQGQELGATNPKLQDFSLYNDVDTLTKYKELVQDLKILSEEEFKQGIAQNSRDNGRTPMHWNVSINAGFNEGAKPWLFMNDNYHYINVDSELSDGNSVLNFYKKLIKLRKSTCKEVILTGSYEELEQFENHPDLFIYRRKKRDEELIIICNLGEEEIAFNSQIITNEYDLVIHNYDKVEKTLRPYEVIVVGGRII